MDLHIRHGDLPIAHCTHLQLSVSQLSRTVGNTHLAESSIEFCENTLSQCNVGGSHEEFLTIYESILRKVVEAFSSTWAWDGMGGLNDFVFLTCFRLGCPAGAAEYIPSCLHA